MASNKIDFKLYDPFSQLHRVKEIWVSLLKKCPHSYYLSWSWIETWVQSLPVDCNISLVAGLKDKSPVIAFFLGFKTLTRHKFFKVSQIALNQTLIPYIDIPTYIEYNAMLIDPAITISLESFLEQLPVKSWDEFFIARCSSIYQSNLIINQNLSEKYELNIEKIKSYYINLDKVRSSNNDYLSLLSHNKRKQIRRSIKEYEKMGEIQTEIADNLETALKIYEEMIELHQKRWTERGHPGVFSNQYAVDFYKTLIHKRFDYGEIQLIRTHAGNQTIGCQYNYAYNGDVFAILSGFNYIEGSHYRPGIISDYCAILHNAKKSMRTYDYLQGDYEYMKSMSTDTNIMDTITIQKKSIKLEVERIMVKLYRIYKKALALVV